MVVLTNEERRQYCIELAPHLPRLRKLLNCTQAEFGALCGFSRIRISHIENGKEIMSWSQFTSILFVCSVNARTKEYLYSNGLLSVRLMQYFQMKEENILPEYNVNIRPEAVAYLKVLNNSNSSAER